MKMSPEKSNNHGNDQRQIPQIDGKKIFAGGLVLVLVFMWIKVFLGKPSPVDAANEALKVANEQIAEKESQKIKRVDLPFEFGRHDRLKTDMFSPKDININNDKDGAKNGQKDRERIKSLKDAASKLAEKVQLEAIVLGTDNSTHQAFINGKMQIAGDIIRVKLNKKVYELLVQEIFHNKVVFKWNEYTISVRMAKVDSAK